MIDDGAVSSETSLSVLYVDPNAADRRRTVRDLESVDDAITVEAVATAADLREELLTGAYACVVTEYDLEETDAFSAYDALRTDEIGTDGPASIPFVLYTDDGDEALASEAITDGFSGYVPKGREDSIERLDDQLRTIVGIDADGSAARRRDRDLEQYRTLVETVGDSMYVLDADGRIEMANDAMAETLGVSREELVGEAVTEFVRRDDAERITTLLEEICTTDGRSWGTTEILVTILDEEPCAAEVNVAPLTDDDGWLTGSVGVVRDIEARKQREQQIRQLHDGTRRLMAATETEAIARIVSDIACEALDLRLNSVFLYEEQILTRSAAETPSPRPDGHGASGRSGAEAAEPTGAAAESVTAADDAPVETGGLVPAAMSNQAIDLFGTVGYIEPDGGIAWDAYEAGEAIVHGDVRRAPNVRNPRTSIRSEAHIPLGEHGIFIVSSLAVNDFDPESLTLARILAANAEAALDRAERESELAERSRELERQNDRLEAFASTVAHDLRNPLTLSTGHLALLAEHVDGDGERHLTEIEWALDRMDELVENVLTLARSGQRLTETGPVHLAAVVAQAHRTVDPELEVVCDGPLPTVDADEARLCVLFENAFRNAREHAGEDVTVTVSRTAAGFAIDDDGPGIPPEERETALEWGYSTSTEGTGFGLAIVTEVVEAHDWSISLGESPAGGLRLAVSVDT